MTDSPLMRFLVAGKGPESVAGMDDRFQQSLAAMFADRPAGIEISSGYRTPQRQAELWQGALKKYGSPDIARRWVAPPGRSQHNHGMAADLHFDNDEARQWAHTNAAKYGLKFPLSNEAWHVELDGARDGQGAQPAAPAPAATMTASAAPSGPVAAAVGPAQAFAPKAALADVFASPAGQELSLAGLLPQVSPFAGAIDLLGQRRQQDEEQQAENERRKREALLGAPPVDSLGQLFG